MLALLAYPELQVRQLGPLVQAGCLVPLHQSLQGASLHSVCPMHRVQHVLVMQAAIPLFLPSHVAFLQQADLCVKVHQALAPNQ